MNLYVGSQDCFRYICCKSNSMKKQFFKILMEESMSKVREHSNTVKGCCEVLTINDGIYCQENLDKLHSSNMAWNQEMQNYMQATKMYFSL